MNKEDYISASTSTRIYEKNLLKKSELERLIDLNSVKEILDALNDTVYRDSLTKLAKDTDYELILKNELKRVYRSIYNTSPDKRILLYLEEEYNFHNLKVILKEIVQDEDLSSLYVDIGNIDLAFIKKNLIKEANKNAKLLQVIEENSSLKANSDALVNEKYLNIAKSVLDKYKQSNNPQDIDIYLDRQFYKALLEDAEDIGLDRLTEFTKERIDLINIKTLLRIKSQDQSYETLKKALINGGFLDKEKLLADYGVDLSKLYADIRTTRVSKYLRKLDDNESLDENILRLERAIDTHVIDFTSEAKSETYGPMVLINYVISKEVEIKNLRIIFVSKLNSLSKESTLERLRKSNV